MKRTKYILCISFLFFVVLSKGQVPQLWGMTAFGGTNLDGTIIQINVDGTGIGNPYSFLFPTNFSSHGSLLQANNGKLYGLANGGIDTLGILFSFNPIDSLFTDLVDFIGANGNYRTNNFQILNSTSLIQATDGMLYGMTTSGGAKDSGVLFRFDPALNIYTKLFDFGDTFGAFPGGKLMQASNGKLYGMTYGGGVNNAGVIFNFNLSGNVYSKLFDLTTVTGINPNGALTEASSGILYGLTTNGGSNFDGTLLSFDTTSNICLPVHDLLSATDGSIPHGSLTVAANGNLYGMTNRGGTNFVGTIFSFNPISSVFTKVHDFNFTGGGFNPFGSMLNASDGMLYGMTGSGGAFDTLGTIFRFNPDSNTYIKLVDFDGYNGGYAYGDLIEINPNSPCSARFNLFADTTQLHHYIAVNNAVGVPPLTYDWSWGDSTHDFIAYPNHTYADSGYYNICLTITDSTGCTNTFCDSSYFVQRTSHSNAMVYVNVYSPLSVGVSETNLPQQISIYPNPTQGQFTIRASQSTIRNVEIYNLLGEKVFSEQLNAKYKTINTKLSQGIYFVRVSDEEKNVVRKLIVE